MSREYEELQIEKWVNLEDVADYLSIRQDTVRTWIKRRSYQCTGPTNDILEVDKWAMEDRRVN